MYVNMRGKKKDAQHCVVVVLHYTCGEWTFACLFSLQRCNKLHCTTNCDRVAEWWQSVTEVKNRMH